MAVTARYLWAIVFVAGLDMLTTPYGWHWFAIATTVAGLAGFVDATITYHERVKK